MLVALFRQPNPGVFPAAPPPLLPHTLLKDTQIPGILLKTLLYYERSKMLVGQVARVSLYREQCAHRHMQECRAFHKPLTD
jgi:hypothetical protein